VNLPQVILLRPIYFGLEEIHILKSLLEDLGSDF
jgi:hypothetical protein